PAINKGWNAAAANRSLCLGAQIDQQVARCRVALVPDLVGLTEGHRLDSFSARWRLRMHWLAARGGEEHPPIAPDCLEAQVQTPSGRQIKQTFGNIHRRDLCRVASLRQPRGAL